jgi:hypothetical protein
MTNDQFPMTKRNRQPSSNQPIPRQKSIELYHVIIHCRDEPQQRELYERLRREGHRCRLTVL